MDLFQPVMLYPGDGSAPVPFRNLRLALIAVMTGLHPVRRDAATIAGRDCEIGFDDIQRLYHDLKPLGTLHVGALFYTPAAMVAAF